MELIHTARRTGARHQASTQGGCKVFLCRSTRHPESNRIQWGSDALRPMCSQAGAAKWVRSTASWRGGFCLRPCGQLSHPRPLSPFGFHLLCHLGLHHLLLSFLFSVISPHLFLLSLWLLSFILIFHTGKIGYY